MSTTATAAVAAAPAAGAATTTTTTPNKIPADIRRRAQGLTTQTKEEIEADKVKVEKAAQDAAAKTAEEKRLADEAKAKADASSGAAGAPVTDKVKKVKAGPPLPEPKPAEGKSVEEMVKDALAKDAKDAASATPILSPEVEREVDLARFAAKKHPDRYAGHADKIIGFYQSRDAMLAEKAKELGGQNSGEFRDYIEGDEYKEWVRQNRPAYQRGDVAKLQEDMIADRARAEARAELAPEIRALERKTLGIELAPVIQRETEGALKIILTDPNAEKDPALAGFAANPLAFGEQHPDEARLIAQEASATVELIREVHQIERNIVEFDPKRPTERQAEISKSMGRFNASLRAIHPQGIEAADGKILIDATTYDQHRLERNPRYRVFNATEIGGMLAAEANARVLEKLRQRREGVAKSIYAPKAQPAATGTNSQAATPVEDAPPSPDAHVSRPSGGKGKPAETKMQAAKNRLLNGK